MVHPFALERPKEASHRRAIVPSARTIHARQHAMDTQHGLLVTTGVVAALMRMVDESWPWLAPLDGHAQSSQRQLARHPLRHRPAHDPATEQVQDGCQIEAALQRLDTGDAQQTFLIRPLSTEIPLQSVGRRPLGLTAPGRCSAPPGVFGPQALGAYQTRRPILAAQQAHLPHDLIDARTAVGLINP